MVPHCFLQAVCALALAKHAETRSVRRVEQLLAHVEGLKHIHGLGAILGTFAFQVVS